MDFLHKFCLTVASVTALPFGRKAQWESPAGLSKYLPAVGLLIGALLFAAAHTLQSLAVSHSVAAILLAILWLVLSGAIHFDGLMDTADGVFSHRSPERILEIMRDSRVGNFGVLTGVAVLLIKIAGLISLAAGPLSCALLLAPAWARWCEVYAIGKFPYARPEGMGKVWHDTTTYPNDVIVAAVVPLAATVLCALSFGTGAALAISAACIVAGLTSSHYLQSIVLGHTGDTYGAVVELAEAGGLLLLILLGKWI